MLAGVGVGGLGCLHGDTPVPDLRSVPDRAKCSVGGGVQRSLALAVGGVHRLDHRRVLYWTRRLVSYQLCD